VSRSVRITLAILALIAAVIASTRFLGDEPMPRDQLIAKYGTHPSQFLKLPSGSVAHYRDSGGTQALPLILLPAMNDSVYQWEPWSLRLRDKLRIIAVDLPGQGLTVPAAHETYEHDRMVSFVEEFAKALDLQRFAIGGSSFGGLIAARFAIEHPEIVTHLVLVSPAGIVNAESEPPIAMRLAQTPFVRHLLRVVPLRRVFQGYLKGAIGDDALVADTLVDRYWDLNRGRATEQLRRFAVFGASFTGEAQILQDRLREVPAPGLILGGREDKGSPPSSMAAYASYLRDGELIIYDGVGHFAMIEVPDQSAGDARQFFEQHPVSESAH